MNVFIKMPKILENVEEKIIEEAEGILLNEGYSALSLRKLAKKSHIAVGTIYNYFKDKNSNRRSHYGQRLDGYVEGDRKSM